MKKFAVPVSFYINKDYLVEAHSLEDAIQLVKNLPNLTDGIWTIGKENHKIIVGVSSVDNSEEPLIVFEEGVEELDHDDFIEEMQGIDPEGFDGVEGFISEAE
jgi:hypothetical protein